MANLSSRSRLHVAVASTILLLMFAMPELGAQSLPDAGYVLSINGNWKSSSSKNLLKQFQSLPSGARVVAVKPITKESVIAIALFDGTTIRNRCKAGTCQKINLPITNPSSSTFNRAAEVAKKPEPSFKDRVAAAFVSLFHSTETYFIPVIIREEATANLREAVLESSSGQVALGPALKDLPNARYRLIAKELPEDQPEASTKSVSLTIDWNPNQPAQAKAALDPGLYELIGPGNLQSWVLVTSSDRYPEARDSFAKALELSTQWSNEVDPASSRMFLRAFLATLSKNSAESIK